MAKQFYYQHGDTTVGPCDSQQLRAAVAHGEVQPETIIRLGESGQKVPAHKLRGLFENGHAARAAASGGTGNLPRTQNQNLQAAAPPPPTLPPDLPAESEYGQTAPEVPASLVDNNGPMPAIASAARSPFKPRDYSAVETYVLVLKVVGFILAALAILSFLFSFVIMFGEFMPGEGSTGVAVGFLINSVVIAFAALMIFVAAQLMAGMVHLFRDNHRQLHFVELISDRILSDTNE